jgi:hypothetical protein
VERRRHHVVAQEKNQLMMQMHTGCCAAIDRANEQARGSSVRAGPESKCRGLRARSLERVGSDVEDDRDAGSVSVRLRDAIVCAYGML